MKNKKLLSMFSVAGALLLGGCAQEASEETSLLDQILEDGKITMATSPDYAPYEFIDPTKTGDDMYVGADIELGKYIAEQLGVEFELKIMDFSAVLAAIGEGKVDIAISGLGYKPERAEAMNFSTTYNPSEETVDPNAVCSGEGVMVLKENASQYEGFSDLAGQVVAAQSGSLQEMYVQEQLTDSTIQTVASLSDGVLRVQSEKVDALAISCTTGEQYMAANDDVTMLPFTFIQEYAGTMVGIVKGEDELTEKINEIIDEVLELGLYEEWEEFYGDYASDLGIN